MKNFKSFNRLFLLLPFVALLGKCEKDDNFLENQRIHRITLTCDTIPDSDNFNGICSFGQREGSNEKYTIDAAVGDIVIWDGELSNPKEGKIKIDNIIYESGVDIFKNKNIHDRQDGKDDGQIVAIIKQGKVGDELKYKLRFTAYDSQSKPVVTDTIDPKIRLVTWDVRDSIKDTLGGG